MNRIVPHLWFDNQAEQAVELYTSVFPNSRVVRTHRYSEAGARVSGKPAGSVMTITFELDGQPFVALNGGPHFQLSEAVSFMVTCNTQEELDALWGRLAQGGTEQPCGWLKDRFGLSWQITPAELEDMLAAPDGARTERVMEALLTMTRIDIQTLRDAFCAT